MNTEAPRPEIDIADFCACSAVGMRVAGTVRSMLLCACLDCQKSTGAGHNAVFMVAEDAVECAGPVKTHDRVAASGAIFTRSFCPACGTPLFGKSSRAPQMRMVPVGFFAGQTDWFRPTQLIFARSHMEWDAIPLSIPHHQTYRGGGVR